MTFKTSLLTAAWIVIVFPATVPHALCQAVATVQIGGLVQDATGAVVPTARVTATQTATGLTRSMMTGADGSYVMSQLPIGPYQLSVEKTGFKVYVQKGIVIQVGENPTVNVTLELGSVGQSVEVTANTVMVETRETSQSTVIDQARITELPVGHQNSVRVQNQQLGTACGGLHQRVRCEVMIALVLAVIAYCRAFFIGRHHLGLEVAALRQ